MKPLPQLSREIEAAIPMEKLRYPTAGAARTYDELVAQHDAGLRADEALRNLASDGGLEALAQAVRDAGRYRWLRDTRELHASFFDNYGCLKAETDLDAAIDSAMKEEGK